MKNIEYLEKFFRKHNLSGRITVNYLDDHASDEYMSTIIFEDGEEVNINDIIFDIDSELENDIFSQWLNDRKEKDMTLIEWITSDNHYMPKNIDTSSIDEYKKEMEDIVSNLKENITNLFQFVNESNDDKT